MEDNKNEFKDIVLGLQKDLDKAFSKIFE